MNWRLMPLCQCVNCWAYKKFFKLKKLTLDVGKWGGCDLTDPTDVDRRLLADQRLRLLRLQPKRPVRPRPAGKRRRRKACEAAGRLFLARILQQIKFNEFSDGKIQQLAGQVEPKDWAEKVCGCVTRVICAVDCHQPSAGR
jgi:hypothetical protein